MKILAIETFYGGAHRQFIDGLIEHSEHDYTLVTLPDELWKWRLKTGALEIAQQIDDIESFDLVFCTDLINLGELKSLVPGTFPPVVLYYHENQHSYPPEEGRSPDFHIRWIDFSNALTAEKLVFNSHFQMNSFIDALPNFLKEIPCSTIDSESAILKIREKSSVIYPGTETPEFSSKEKNGSVPRIVWNHRWEYDKNPKQFLRVMKKIKSMGTDFELVLLGESQKFPSDIYESDIEELQDRIVHRGWLPSRDAYFEMLRCADIVISTSNQENFGLSIVEAMQSGCYPLLPYRIAYPEVLPEQFHSDLLYRSEKELVYKLNSLLNGTIPDTTDLAKQLQVHHWQNRIREFDSLFNSF